MAAYSSIPANPSGRNRKHAIISGGSSGIGLALAAQFCAEGLAVSILARDTEKLQEARLRLIEAGASEDAVYTHSVDVMEEADCARAVADCIREFGPPAWAVAAAGIVEPGTFEDLPLASHRRHMESNYFGTVHFLHAAVPAMRDAGGNLVIISSGAAIIGIYGYAAYGPSKFALRGLAETLRVELKPAGISVTIVYPPDTDTPLLKEELRLRDQITNDVAAFAGLWAPEDVARHIIRTAKAGRFASTPGWRTAISALPVTAFSALFRAYQHRIVKRHLAKQKKSAE